MGDGQLQYDLSERKGSKMAVFTKSNRTTSNAANTTIVAAGTRIEGEMVSRFRIHVDGEFSGPVSSDSSITIGKTGLIEGHLCAKELVVTGRFSGTAICETVRILGGGRISGRITSNILEIEKGCLFHGQNIFKEAAEIADLTQGKNRLYEADNILENVTAIPIASGRADCRLSGYQRRLAEGSNHSMNCQQDVSAGLAWLLRSLMSILSRIILRPIMYVLPHGRLWKIQPGEERAK